MKGVPELKKAAQLTLKKEISESITSAILKKPYLIKKGLLKKGIAVNERKISSATYYRKMKSRKREITAIDVRDKLKEIEEKDEKFTPFFDEANEGIKVLITNVYF